MTRVNAITWGLAILLIGAGAAAAQDPSVEEQALKKLTADLPQSIKAADADGNGALNAAEFKTYARAIRKSGEQALNGIDPTIAQKKAAKELKKYDANTDGKLDAEETKKRDEEARLKAIKDFDWDRNGQLSEREKTAMQWAEEGDLDYRFTKVDTNADGSASAEELTAALSYVTGIKVKKPKA
jgi:Ca2+-binding EF-hand superfamily protein